jgi:hypothetical protein
MEHKSLAALVWPIVGASGAGTAYVDVTKSNQTNDTPRNAKRTQQTGLLVWYFDSAIGILFLGTPHGGADPRDLYHHVLQILMRIVGVKANPDTIATLLPNSPELEQLRDEFLPMDRKHQWVIISFQEHRGSISQRKGRKLVGFDVVDHYC